MAGRQPLPTSVKKLRGTYRRDRAPEGEVHPPGLDEIPDPPEHIGAEGMAFWRQSAPMLAELGLLTATDLPAFEALCVHYNAMVEAARMLVEHGQLVEGQTGLKKNPAHQIFRDNSTAFRQYCGMFGLSPADRSRFGVQRLRVADNPFINIAG